MWPTEPGDVSPNATDLWFLAGETLVQVRPERDDALATAVLAVEAPEELAARQRFLAA